MPVLPTYIPISNDKTGVADYKTIQRALQYRKRVLLDSGTYYINDMLRISSCDGGNRLCTLEGCGQGTILHQVNPALPAIKGIGSPNKPIALNCRLANLEINGGLHGLELSLGTQVCCHYVVFADSQSHAVYIHDGGWIYTFWDCDFRDGGGDGINAIGTLTTQNGNNLSVSQCRFTSMLGCGIRWCAAGLHVAGSLFEGNGHSGIKIEALCHAAYAANINGCYFERNRDAHIECEGRTDAACIGVDIRGNYMHQPTTYPCIKVHGDPRSVRNGVVARSNTLTTNGPAAIILTDAAIGWEVPTPITP